MVGSIDASVSRANLERTPLLGNGRAAFNGTYGTAGQDALPAPEARDTAIQETQLSHDAGIVNGHCQDRRSGSELRKGGLARQVAPDLLRGLLMIFMALDHVSVSMSAYPHGTNGPDGEKAGRDIHLWASDLAYALRTLTHLCAPGFAMLLGMGIAFFMASRANQGWTTTQFLQHFFKRMIAIIVVNEVAFIFVIVPLKVWLFNAVLWALGIDYFIVGVVAIAINQVFEPACAKLYALVSGEARDQPQAEDDDENEARDRSGNTASAKQMAFHLINALLFAISAVLLWSNIWLDPKQGDCDIRGRQEIHPFAPINIPDSGNCNGGITSLIYEFFFHSMACLNVGVFSGFPPIPWLSFSLFGLLYGRLLLSGQTRKQTASSDNHRTPPVVSRFSLVVLEATLAVAFALLFVSTRLLRYGNLSTNCLRRAPLSLFDFTGIAKEPNPYLASPKAFFFIVKYPPSPAFAFFTMSGCFALLTVFALLTASAPSISHIGSALRSERNPLLVFGRQPLFFYALHMLLIKGASLVIPFIPGLTRDLPRDQWGKGPDEEPQRGIGLGSVYFASWLAVLVILYPVCKRYGHFKSRQSPDSLWRFL